MSVLPMTAEPRTLRTEAEQALSAAFDTAEQRLPGNAAVRLRRRGAIDLFRRAGLPTRRVEAWKYTDLRAAIRHAAPLAVGPGGEAALRAVLGEDPLSGLDRTRLVIADGFYRPELSDTVGLEGLTVTSLAEALASGDPAVGALFTDDLEVTLALNTAFATGGVLLRIAANVEIAEPVEILHVATGAEPTAIFARTVILVEEGASCRLIETWRGPDGVAHQVSSATELTVGDRARVKTARLVAGGDAALHVGSLIVRVGREAEYDDAVLTAGAALSRLQTYLTIAGDRARIGLNGATLLGGKWDPLESTCRHASLSIL